MAVKRVEKASFNFSITRETQKILLAAAGSGQAYSRCVNDLLRSAYEFGTQYNVPDMKRYADATRYDKSKRPKYRKFGARIEREVIAMLRKMADKDGIDKWDSFTRGAYVDAALRHNAVRRDE